MTRIASVAALIAFAGSATAQFTPGSLLYISDIGTTGGVDTINVLDYGPLTTATLFSFGPDTQDTSRRGGLAQGPDGEFYVGRSDIPVLDPSTAVIDRVDDLFGTPSASNFASNPELQTVTGIRYDSFTDSLVVLNNPGSAFGVPQDFEGVQTYDRATGSYDGLQVPESFTNPGVQAVGGGLVPTGRNAGEYYFGSLNGGAGFDGSLPGNGSRTSTVIARAQFNNPADPSDVTVDFVIDLEPNATGRSEFFGLLRGMATLPNGNIAFLDANSFNIWEVVLDSSGNFDSLEVLFDGTAVARGDNGLGRGIIYNEFTDKLNYIEFAGDGTQDIVEINLDGTGRTILASGIVGLNSLVAIPAPSTAALLGLGGLAAARRRR
ncbi:MAG: PEP-CTERM sorting domain-containing protein [Planctomycetota bacterium]